MSLLLQALQKAAKNRESSAPAAASEVSSSLPPQPEPEPIELTPSPSFSLEPSSTAETLSQRELSIEEEDIFEPEELARAPLAEPQPEHFEPFASSAPESARAASILRASETPTTGRLDWIRDHPVHTFAVVAGVFMVFYGAYVYLQLFHPALLRGDFVSKPFAGQTPPPPTQPIKPPPAPVAEAAPAPVVAAVTPAGPTPAPGGPGAAAPTAAPMVGMPATTSSNPAPAAPAAQAPITSPKPPAAPPSVAQASPRVPSASPARPRARMRSSAEASSASIEDNLARKDADPGGSPVSPNMAQAYQALQDGNVDRAESLYREVIQSDAQNIDAMLGLATIAAQRGNAQQAIGFYERALELEPRNPVAQAGLIAIIGQADPQTSETRLKQLIAREPSPFLYFNLGNLYSRQDQWAAAQGAYFQAYQMQPDNADYAYNLAIGLEHLNQPKLALTYYRKAVELSFQKGRANFDQKRVIERIGQLSARIN